MSVGSCMGRPATEKDYESDKSPQDVTAMYCLWVLCVILSAWKRLATERTKAFKVNSFSVCVQCESVTPSTHGRRSSSRPLPLRRSSSRPECLILTSGPPLRVPPSPPPAKDKGIE